MARIDFGPEGAAISVQRPDGSWQYIARAIKVLIEEPQKEKRDARSELPEHKRDIQTCPHDPKADDCCGQPAGCHRDPKRPCANPSDFRITDATKGTSVPFSEFVEAELKRQNQDTYKYGPGIRNAPSACGQVQRPAPFIGYGTRPSVGGTDNDRVPEQKKGWESTFYGVQGALNHLLQSQAVELGNPWGSLASPLRGFPGPSFIADDASGLNYVQRDALKRGFTSYFCQCGFCNFCQACNDGQNLRRHDDWVAAILDPSVNFTSLRGSLVRAAASPRADNPREGSDQENDPPRSKDTHGYYT